MCVRHRRLVVAVWLVFVVAMVGIVKGVGAPTSNNLTLPGTDSTKAEDLLQDKLPKEANGSNPVVMEAPHEKIKTGKNDQAAKATVHSLTNAPNVLSAM